MGDWKEIGRGSWGREECIIEDNETDADAANFYRSEEIESLWGSSLRFEKCCDPYHLPDPFSWIILSITGSTYDELIPSKVQFMEDYRLRNNTVVRMITSAGNPGLFVVQIEICYKHEMGTWYIRWNKIGQRYNYYSFDYEAIDIVLHTLKVIRNTRPREKFEHIKGWENIDKAIELSGADGSYVPNSRKMPSLYLLWAVFNEKWREGIQPPRSLYRDDDDSDDDDEEFYGQTAIFEDWDGGEIMVNFLSGSHLKVYRNGDELTDYFYNMRGAVADHIVLLNPAPEEDVDTESEIGDPLEDRDPIVIAD